MNDKIIAVFNCEGAAKIQSAAISCSACKNVTQFNTVQLTQINYNGNTDILCVFCKKLIHVEAPNLAKSKSNG